MEQQEVKIVFPISAQAHYWFADGLHIGQFVELLQKQKQEVYTMRTPEEMIDLVLSIAKEDERIRAVTMGGSRANADCPVDVYQDFDIAFYVDDVTPFWDNVEWIKEKFGMPSLMHKPESMELIPPA